MGHRLASLSATLLAGAILLTGHDLRADQNDPRLNDLFVSLQEVENPVEARTIEGTIWQIWMTSANEEVNGLMQEGVTAMKTGDLKTAIVDFTKIIEIDPKFAEGWNKRATVLYMAGDFEGSTADVDKTLALEPRHFGALSGLGLILAARDRGEEAIAAWKKALAVNPHMPAVRGNIEDMRRKLEDDSI